MWVRELEGGGGIEVVDQEMGMTIQDLSKDTYELLDEEYIDTLNNLYITSSYSALYVRDTMFEYCPLNKVTFDVHYVQLQIFPAYTFALQLEPILSLEVIYITYLS